MRRCQQCLCLIEIVNLFIQRSLMNIYICVCMLIWYLIFNSINCLLFRLHIFLLLATFPYVGYLIHISHVLYLFIITICIFWTYTTFLILYICMYYLNFIYISNTFHSYILIYDSFDTAHPLPLLPFPFF